MTVANTGADMGTVIMVAKTSINAEVSGIDHATTGKPADTTDTARLHRSTQVSSLSP
jgi:hypothetical protein